MTRLPLGELGEVEAAACAAHAVRAAAGIVLLPTETYYGLGADPSSAVAVARIRGLKGRPEEMPLSVLCAGWPQVEELVEVPERYRAALEASWPGPLTAILTARTSLPCADGCTLAVRIPGHLLLCAVLERCGPLTGTSANRHDAPPSTRADAALASLLGRPDLILDGGTTPGGLPSTLVDLSGARPQVLRKGSVRWLEQV
jgi:L-threonylcarbamoyladenylate synthase